MKKRLLSFGIVLTLLLTQVPLAMAYNTSNTGAPATFGAGSDAYAAIMEDGTLWTWGWNLFGQLGNQSDNEPMGDVTKFKIMDDVASVSMGYYYAAAVKTDGTLWTWGENKDGKLGYRLGTMGSNTPVKVMDNVTAVSTGSYHAAAIKADGSLWTWGDNSRGQLGDNTEGKRDTPAKIMDNVIAVSAEGLNTAVIKTDGTLWIWGGNGRGQLGNGVINDGFDVFSTPVKVMDDVIAVSMGNACVAAIKSDHTLWTWGSRVDGRLGDGTTENRATPIKIMEDVGAVSMGDTHAAAVKTDGTLWIWGNNHNGQIGNDGGVHMTTLGEQVGGSLEQTFPVNVLDDVVAVSTGLRGTSALRADGTLWTWGDILNSGTLMIDNISKPPVKTMDNIRLPASSAPVTPSPVPTVPVSSCKATLDGKPVTLNAYLFPEGSGGTNYVMLRDVAYLLNGTAAQFEVGWTAKDGITITTGQAYTPVGGEMQGKGDGNKPYTANASTITIGGKSVELTAYTIEGNNYFKLRDLGTALGFGVDWDGASGTVVIDTASVD